MTFASRFETTLRIAGVLIALLCIFASGIVRADFHDRFVVLFPQVVRGTTASGLVSYETTIVVTSPHITPLSVALSSTLVLPVSSFEIGPGETRTISMAAQGPLEAGWVRLEAAKPMAASAHILTRSQQPNITSEVTVLGQPPTSKAVVSVFRTSGASGDKSRAENTAFAIVAVQSGRILLTLRDEQGALVASRSLVACNACPSRDFSTHLARFITELFPNLPATFRSGSLMLEHVEPSSIPQSLAVTALYVKESNLWAAEVTPIDVPATYLLRLKPVENIQQRVQELAAQYGFTVSQFSSGDPNLAIILASEEIARAVARDPRVASLRPNIVIQF